MSQPDEKVLALIRSMQDVFAGQNNADIAVACSYIIANAVAILGADRPDAERMLRRLAREQKGFLDNVWPQVRARLEEMEKPRH